jgi:integrase
MLWIWTFQDDPSAFLAGVLICKGPGPSLRAELLEPAQDERLESPSMRSSLNAPTRLYEQPRRRAPPIRWHDLRHTCATLLLGRGVHPKLVQHLLGYASITMTLERYSHWIPSMGRHAADGMDEALG